MQVDILDATVSFGARTVFTRFNAHFPAGEVTALVGPSGSGKSTLMAVISGYQALCKGRVELRSDDASAPTLPRPSVVAWVPQGSNALGRRSVLDNVSIAALSAGYDLHTANLCARDALEIVGLATQSHQRARELSGGELQRVALARALASGKELILADEPSANLDAENTKILATILSDLTTRATIIVATHDPLLVTSTHSVVQMRGGGRNSR